MNEIVERERERVRYEKKMRIYVYVTECANFLVSCMEMRFTCLNHVQSINNVMDCAYK